MDNCWSCCRHPDHLKGAFIFYVDNFWVIFNPSLLLHRQFIYWGLCTNVDIWKTPSSLYLVYIECEIPLSYGEQILGTHIFSALGSENHQWDVKMTWKVYNKWMDWKLQQWTILFLLLGIFESSDFFSKGFTVGNKYIRFVQTYS